MPEDTYLVGRILGAWGIRGEVTVEVITDNPDRFRPGSKLYASGVEMTIARVRESGGKVVVAFEGITTRDEAATLHNTELDVPAAALPQLGPGEYYHHQILGLRAVTTEGRELGSVTDILSTGANDVYVVTDSKREYLIPAIADAVASIDLSQGLLTIIPIPGLLDPT